MFESLSSRHALSAIVVAGTLLTTQASHADTLKVLTSGAFRQVAVALAPAYEARTGNKVDIVNDTAGEVMKRVQGGEAFDVLVLPPASLETLAAAGRVAPDSVVPLAKASIGVAVKAGAPLPDISTVDAFKRAVTNARHVAYTAPSSGGSSGIYIDKLFVKLGIADEVKPRAVLVQGGLVAEKLVSGEADLVVHSVSEILPVAGATLVGPLPEAIQNYTSYGGAVAANAAHADAARALLAGFHGAAADATIKAKGMIPE